MDSAIDQAIAAAQTASVRQPSHAEREAMRIARIYRIAGISRAMMNELANIHAANAQRSSFAAGLPLGAAAQPHETLAHHAINPMVRVAQAAQARIEEENKHAVVLATRRGR